MKNPLAIWTKFLCGLTIICLSHLPVWGVATNSDWNLTVLDQLIASAPTGDKYVPITDMQVPVAYLQGWRAKLAGAPEPKSAFYNGFIPWTGGNVYYSFDASVAPPEQKVFLDCCAEWATFANLRFMPRTSQTNYILVTNNPTLNGGVSAVGMSGGAQLLQIGPGAWNHSTVCHELGHALGMCHEHQRSDRNSYVTINTNNIISGHLPDFVLLTSSTNKGPYDFLSVMHYGRNFFSVSPTSNTIVPLPAYSQYLNVMGQRFDPVLSTNDRAGMAQIYGVGPGATSVVTNTQDSGPGSLRAALYYAYDRPGTTITFNIPTTDPGYSNNVFNILPTDVLPSLVNATTLNGGSEPTNSNPSGPEILLNGALSRPPSVYSSGLLLKGTNCTVRSLTINNFVNFGIFITGTNAINNTVSGCYVGVDPTGNFAVTNGITPVQIEGGAVSNTIGGLTVADRNIISGSALQGLTIRDAGTCFNVVQGNYLGLKANGTAALPNTWAGIQIYGGAQSNLIGGYTASAANVISGNLFQGVLVSAPTSSGNVIAGNLIGVNAAGTAALANGWSGVEISGPSGNVVGGTNTGAGNVISGNGNYGVALSSGSTGNLVQGNLVGLNAAGTVGLPNSFAGVGIYGGASANTIGGFSSGARNVISGNANDGVVITGATSTGNLVAGNYIGLNPSGTSALGNGWTGVDVQGNTANNTVASNVISGNGNYGIYVVGSFNSIWGNLIGLNAAGSAPVGNNYAGIGMFATAQSNTVGGVTRAMRNIISGNNNQGVVLSGTPVARNLVQGNYIGLNSAGTAAIANSWSGIELSGGSTANSIGGVGGARNFISGNGNYGISINNSANGNIIQGNTIGLNATNGTAIPNTYVGIVMFAGAQSNLVGGVTPGAANLISASTGDGIQLFNVNTTNNAIRGNSIFGNSGNAIGLYNPGDVANLNLAAPNLATAVVTTNTTVTGTYTGTNGVVYQLDFYSDVTPAGSAEAQTYLGSRSITGTGASAAFTANLGALLPTGRAVTATATDPAGNTSRVSTGVAISMTSANNDGIPNAWRTQLFGTTTTNALTAASSDFDGDRISNLNEFLAGTNPTNAASVFKLTAQNPVTTTNAVALNSANGIVYRVWSRDDLSAGNWEILADQVIGTGTNVFLADPAASVSAKRFYRAQVLW
jgi:hypothetical protein